MMHSSVYHAGSLATSSTPVMRGEQKCMTPKKLFTHTCTHTHTETHGEIPQHSTALQHEFQQLLSYLTVHNITAEKTGGEKEKEKAPHLKNAVYTNTGLWIHPLAWKNKSLQYNHFSINVWKYFTAWCNKSVMRLWAAVRALKGLRVKVNFPGQSPEIGAGHILLKGVKIWFSKMDQ